MTSTPTRPILAGLAAASALTVAASVLVATPAQAAGFTSAVLGVSTNFSAGGGSCSITSGGASSQNVPFTSNGAKVTRTINNTAVVTDAGDASDFTNLTSKSTGTARSTQSGGQLKTVSLSQQGTVKVDPNQGSGTDCASAAQATSTVSGVFTLTKAQVLDLRATHAGLGTLAQLQILSASGSVSVEVSVGFSGSLHRVFYLPADDYQIILVGATTLNAPEVSSDPTTRTTSTSMEGTFSKPGSAADKQVGTAAKYLKLGKSLNCSGKLLKSTFKSAAGKKPKKGKTGPVRTAQFKVNGKKAKTFKKPYRGFKAKVKKLPTQQPVLVEVTLTLKNGTKLYARRSYQPCS
ncbi:hypothetical protein [Nocardioides sp.]|uniref:hypothetical protein n=1 Tax=Nocardioides sp. TaxID=35761 RepID=UPI0035634229